MTPTQPLSEQQCRVLQEHLPSYHIRILTGSDDVDKWSDQSLWDAFLAGVHVVVGTPAVLADALTHTFVRMSQLSLLVFDEAHRTTKKHPMNNIMRNFYYPAKQKGEQVPHILGLSASPVMKNNASESGLQAIESNLDATTITPKRFRDDLEIHVHQPTLSHVIYGDALPIDSSPAFHALATEIQTYDLGQDPYVVSLQKQDDIRAQRRLTKVWIKRKTYCTEQLDGLLNRARHIREQLGSAMTEWYICTCARRFLESKDHDLSLMDDLETTEQEHMTTIMTRILSGSEDSNAAAPIDTERISDKAKALLDVLAENAVSDARTIVFVEQRAMVVALAYLLRSILPASTSYDVGTFVGTSSFANRKASLSNLVDHKTPDQDLQDFRSGAKNLIIATTVLEEGLDVPACNCVICFDLPKDLISFVQRRGRARKADSQYMLFISETDLNTDPAKFPKLEEVMKEACMKEDREPSSVAGSEVEDGTHDDTSNIRYQLASSGALLTIDDAKSHLNHFCAVSTRHASRYIDPRPEYQTNAEFTGKAKCWGASVTLPSFVHMSIRTAQSSLPWSSESTAIKEAAFNAYVALHQAGLVNDNLLPVVKDYGRAPGQVHINQPSLVQVAARESMWDVCRSVSHEDLTWHAFEITLFLGEQVIVTQELLLPFPLTDHQTIWLYWNDRITYEVVVTPSHGSVLKKQEQWEDTCGWTSAVLRSIFALQTSSERNDLAFYLSPPSDLLDHSQANECAGSEDASKRLANINDYSKAGLVRVNGQENRAYILQDVEEPPTNDQGTSGSVKELTVTPLPKRRDFLHKPAVNDNINAAYTSTQSFPMSQCTINRVPAPYSLLAAFLPSILHQLDLTSMAQKLNSSALHLSNPSLVVKALCAPSASEQIGDYNRLEYLGDSILKVCTELQLVAQYPTWPEAYLSAEKDRVVRNDNLAKAALDIGLDRFISTQSFTGRKWQPPSLTGLSSKMEGVKRQMSSKVLADVVEALIGAAFVDGGLSKAYECIQTLLPRETWWDADLQFDEILKETLEGPTPVNLPLLEQLVGHTFTFPSLLLEAITHASYPHTNQTSYERLEFLGDAILDLIVTPKLYAHPRELRHWDLHRVHEALVNGSFLGFCCMNTSTSGEARYDIVNVGAEKAPRPTKAKRYHLHDFIRASSQLVSGKQASLRRFEELHTRIASSLQESDIYPWPDLTALQPEKFLSDIVEAVLGALYLDTRGDLAICEAFLEELGVLPILRGILERGVETAFPKERVGILADRCEVLYEVGRPGEDGEGWACVVRVGEREVVRVDGCGGREEAEVRAADRAAEVLVKELERDGVGWRKKRKLGIRGKGEMEAVGLMGEDA